MKIHQLKIIGSQVKLKTGIPPQLEPLFEDKNSYSTVQAEYLGVETYEYAVGEYMQSITSGLTETCDQIKEYTNTCGNDPNECEFSREMLEVSRQTVGHYVHSNFKSMHFTRNSSNTVYHWKMRTKPKLD